MQDKISTLTEIEGAILSEIEHRGHKTAFQVRRAFQQSPSIEWSGSAGSVYPAIKRLRARNLIAAEPTGDAKATMRLSLTDAGRIKLSAWVVDPVRAVSVGIDPFRLRAGIWAALPEVDRIALFRDLLAAISADIAMLESLKSTVDAIESIRIGLNIDLQRARLEWIERQRRAI